LDPKKTANKNLVSTKRKFFRARGPPQVGKAPGKQQRGGGTRRTRLWEKVFGGVKNTVGKGEGK